MARAADIVDFWRRGLNQKVKNAHPNIVKFLEEIKKYELDRFKILQKAGGSTFTGKIDIKKKKN